MDVLLRKYNEINADFNKSYVKLTPNVKLILLKTHNANLNHRLLNLNDFTLQTASGFGVLDSESMRKT